MKDDDEKGEETRLSVSLSIYLSHSLPPSIHPSIPCPNEHILCLLTHDECPGGKDQARPSSSSSYSLFHFFSFVLSDYKPTNQPINRTYGKYQIRNLPANFGSQFRLTDPPPLPAQIETYIMGPWGDESAGYGQVVSRRVCTILPTYLQ